MATDLHRETLKASIATANALATAVGLNPSNSDSLNTGGEIRLSVNPTSESSAKSADANNGSIAKLFSSSLYSVDLAQGIYFFYLVASS